ncbi:MAG TPA: Fe-S cluster assembly protein SufD [Rhizomicrobium sp.]|jgi:Fe-S cluster assembly protein SufD|nr:Fe-S cluster assembly protein SufD [Rhizomicrobium sp.]
MNERATAEEFLLQDFAADAASRPALRPSWLDERRRRAVQSFRDAGVPNRRIEQWKYTDLRGALEGQSATASSKPLLRPDRNPFAAISTFQLSIADGCLGEPNSQIPAGIELFNLGQLDDGAPDWVRQNLGEVLSRSAMGEASLAMMRGGLAMRVSAATTIPVHLGSPQKADSVHCRLLLVIEPGASLVLLESHGKSRGLINLGVEFVLEPNAELTHLRLADSAPDAVQVEEIGIRVARDARYRGHFSQKGARLSRLELAIELEGEGAEAELSGASVLGGKLHADVTTHIDHMAGRTASRQLFKNVAGGNSRAVYQGKITVRKGADGSDSRQTAKAVLLGARAEADLKPELEILADDVKCAHGAAVGDLDADSLFYLRSRGLKEDEARRLLIHGFLEEAIMEIDRDDVRLVVRDFLETGLAQALESGS